MSAKTQTARNNTDLSATITWQCVVPQTLVRARHRLLIVIAVCSCNSSQCEAQAQILHLSGNETGTDNSNGNTLMGEQEKDIDMGEAIETYLPSYSC